jgi:hypothetical protein
MNDQETQLTIAEFLGWQWWKHTKSNTYIFGHPDRTKESLDDKQMQWEKCSRPTQLPPSFSSPPDYCHSLDAMNDAEEKLDCKQMDAYATSLWKSTQKDMPHIRSNLNMYIFVHASSRLRAAAFVEAIGQLPVVKG